MDVLKPNTFTDSMLVSSSAAELEPEWSATTTYSKHAKVFYSSVGVYESLVNSNLGQQPDVSPTAWNRIGPTNRKAMFDSAISTQTLATNSLTVVIDTGAITCLALLNLKGTSCTISAIDLTTGQTIIPATTTSLQGAQITNWFEYFTEPFSQKTEVVFYDLPAFRNTRLTITVSGIGEVAVGHVVFGFLYYIGATRYSPTAGITDYSYKDTDEYGTTTFVKRGFSKRLNAKVTIENKNLDKVSNLMYSLTQTPCLWVGTREPGFTPLQVYGAYKDFSLEVDYPYHSVFVLEVEGLT